jgi:hypothetical protein
MRGFLWMGTEAAQGGKCLVAWNQVQHPLSIGGLGILTWKSWGNLFGLGGFGSTKRIKSMKGAFSLCHAEGAATIAFFLASIRCMVGNGISTLFWTDPWLDGQTIATKAPDLVAAVGNRSQKSRIVQAALQGNSWIRDITRALTIPAIVQYLHLRERVEQVQLQSSVPDSISWCWSASGDFSL